jgi:hypothetical protein
MKKITWISLQEVHNDSYITHLTIKAVYDKKELIL